MNHPCEVWGRGRTRRQRLLDRIRRGHARHVCVRSRPAFRDHDGNHICRCGQTYIKQSTDND